MRNVQLQGIHRQKLYASFEQSSQHCRCTINNPDAACEYCSTFRIVCSHKVVAVGL